MLQLHRALKRFADADIADEVFALAVNRFQRGFGFFCRAVFKLGELEATFAVKLVFDDVFGRFGHGRTCLSGR